MERLPAELILATLCHAAQTSTESLVALASATRRFRLVYLDNEKSLLLATFFATPHRNLLLLLATIPDRTEPLQARLACLESLQPPPSELALIKRVLRNNIALQRFKERMRVLRTLCSVHPPAFIELRRIFENPHIDSRTGDSRFIDQGSLLLLIRTRLLGGVENARDTFVEYRPEGVSVDASGRELPVNRVAQLLYSKGKKFIDFGPKEGADSSGVSLMYHEMVDIKYFLKEAVQEIPLRLSTVLDKKKLEELKQVRSEVMEVVRTVSG